MNSIEDPTQNPNIVTSRISQHLQDLIDSANVTIREHYDTLKEQILEIYETAKLEGFTPFQARLLIKDRVVDVSDRYVRSVLPAEAKDQSKKNLYIKHDAEHVPHHSLNTGSEKGEEQEKEVPEQEQEQKSLHDLQESTQELEPDDPRKGEERALDSYEINTLKSDLERARKIIREQTEQIQQLSVKQVKTFGHKFNYNTDFEYPKGTFIPIIITSFPDKEIAYAIFDEKRGGGGGTQA